MGAAVQTMPPAKKRGQEEMNSPGGANADAGAAGASDLTASEMEALGSKMARYLLFNAQTNKPCTKKKMVEDVLHEYKGRRSVFGPVLDAAKEMLMNTFMFDVQLLGDNTTYLLVNQAHPQVVQGLPWPKATKEDFGKIMVVLGCVWCDGEDGTKSDQLEKRLKDEYDLGNAADDLLKKMVELKYLKREGKKPDQIYKLGSRAEMEVQTRNIAKFVKEHCGQVEDPDQVHEV